MPVLGAMGGCRHRFGRSSSNSSTINTLRIILQGPFAVVMQKDQGYRVKAFVPYDREGKHEFRLGTPLDSDIVRPRVTSCPVGYQFTLSDHGLLTTPGQPYVDRGFDEMLLSVDQWEPKPKEYFVALDLPAPHAISYMPPLYPVQFEPGGKRASEYAQVPLNHVLEYKLVDADDVRIQEKRLEWCGKEVRSEKLGDLRPLPCGELYKRYQELWRDHDDREPRYRSQRPHIESEQTSCSYSTYFFGVGLPPGPKTDEYLMHLADHGVEFYNEKLLPAFYQQQDIPPGKRLKNVGKRAVPPCDAGQADMLMPGMRPAVWQYSAQAPHLEYVTSTDNCTAPGATGTSGRSGSSSGHS